MAKTRELILKMVLTILYFCVVTPLKCILTLRGEKLLPVRGGGPDASFWVSIDLSSSDPAVFETMPAHERKRSRLIRLMLAPWKRLAAKPKSSELSSDLYVLY